MVQLVSTTEESGDNGSNPIGGKGFLNFITTQISLPSKRGFRLYQ